MKKVKFILVLATFLVFMVGCAATGPHDDVRAQFNPDSVAADSLDESGVTPSEFNGM